MMACFCAPGILAIADAWSVEIAPNLGQNLALHKPYTCSDPNKSNWDKGLTDGSWVEKKGSVFATDRSKTFPKAVTIDLQSVEEIAFIHVGTPAFGSTKKIAVSVSADGTRFAEAGLHEFPNGRSSNFLFEFNPTKARFVRLSYLENYREQVRFSPEYCFTTEVEVYRKAGGGPTQTGFRKNEPLMTDFKECPRVELPEGLGPNLALAKPYLCSDEDISYWHTGLTDGLWFMKRGTTFRTNKTEYFPKSVTINLRRSAKLTHVLVGVPEFGSTKSIALSVSYDGISFFEVGSHDFPLGKASSHLFSFEPALARLVRLTYTGNHAETMGGFPQSCCFTTEVEVYAKPGL